MSSTGTSIAIIEKNMPMERITPLVEALDMDKKRFLSTVLLACERTPRLMDFPVQSHIMWASSAAALGLEPDGVTGQAFPIPFGDKVQLIVGYKGFNTMAGRAGITINSGALLEGDEWDQDVQAGHAFRVRQSFGNRANRNLVGVWAQAQMPNGAYSHPLILDLSEVMAVKAKAPGGRKKDSPWNDPKVGFPAMAQKTAVRRLQRTLPALITPGRHWSTHHVGAQMDLMHEEAGRHTRVDLDGNMHQSAGPVIDATVEPPSERATLTPAITLPSGNDFDFKSWSNYGAVISKLRISKPDVVETIHRANADRFKAWADSNDPAIREAATEIIGAIVEITS